MNPDHKKDEKSENDSSSPQLNCVSVTFAAEVHLPPVDQSSYLTEGLNSDLISDSQSMSDDDSEPEEPFSDISFSVPTCSNFHVMVVTTADHFTCSECDRMGLEDLHGPHWRCSDCNENTCTDCEPIADNMPDSTDLQSATPSSSTHGLKSILKTSSSELVD